MKTRDEEDGCLCDGHEEVGEGQVDDKNVGRRAQTLAPEHTGHTHVSVGGTGRTNLIERSLP